MELSVISKDEARIMKMSIESNQEICYVGGARTIATAKGKM